MLKLILANPGPDAVKCVCTAEKNAGDQIQCEALVRGCQEDMPGNFFVFSSLVHLVKNVGLTKQLDGTLGVPSRNRMLCYYEN